MKKKPTKRNKSSKKKSNPILNVLNPKHPLHKKPIEETKVSMGDLYRAVKWATAADRYSEALEKELEAKDRIRDTEKQLVKLRARVAGKRSGEIRRRDRSEYERYDWKSIRKRGHEIDNKHPYYTRYRIAKIIHDEEEGASIPDKIPSLRAIWNRLDFIPSKRTPKLS